MQQLRLLCGVLLIHGAAIASAYWPAHWNNYENSESNAVTVDPAGNVYVAGFSDDGGGNTRDTALVKYTPDGTLVWSKRYSALAGGTDYATKVVATSTGVYIAGLDYDSTHHDAFIIRYSSGGTLNWIRRLTGTGDREDQVRDIAVTPDGGVVATGFIGYDGANSAFVRKYSATTGNTLWAHDDIPQNDHTSVGSCIAVASTGEIYAGSLAYRSATTGNDVTITKYSSGGTQAWRRQVDGGFGKTDSIKDLAVDKQGHVSFIADSLDANSGSDFLVGKFNQNGVLKWTDRVGQTSSTDEGISITTDLHNNIIAAGNVAGPPYALNIRTIKYNTDGDKLWQQDYLGDVYTPQSVDRCLGAAVDADGNVMVGGTTQILGTFRSAFVMIKYLAGGNRESVSFRTPDANDGVIGRGMAINPAGSVFVTGVTDDENGNRMSTYQWNTD